MQLPRALQCPHSEDDDETPGIHAVWKQEGYSFPSDCWALGCLLYELSTSKVPFQAHAITELRRKIIRGKYPPIVAPYSADIRALVRKLLETDVQARWTIDDVLACSAVRQRLHLAPQPCVAAGASLLGTIQVPHGVLDHVAQHLPAAQYQEPPVRHGVVPTERQALAQRPPSAGVRDVVRARGHAKLPQNMNARPLAYAVRHRARAGERLVAPSAVEVPRRPQHPDHHKQSAAARMVAVASPAKEADLAAAPQPVYRLSPANKEPMEPGRQQACAHPRCVGLADHRGALPAQSSEGQASSVKREREVAIAQAHEGMRDALQPRTIGAKEVLNAADLPPAGITSTPNSKVRGGHAFLACTLLPAPTFCRLLPRCTSYQQVHIHLLQCNCQRRAGTRGNRQSKAAPASRCSKQERCALVEVGGRSIAGA
jgi:hypothetical protein